MNTVWEKANKISELGYKIHSAAMVVELVAANVTDNAESGAAWCAVDVLTKISDEIEIVSSEIMTANREQEERIQKLEAIVAKYELKKGKKK
jgi:hypothetical protein